MAWHRSKLFRLLAVLLGLLLAALLLAPYLLDIDRYRATAIEQLEKETGRDVEIEKLRLHFLPRLHLAVVNFRVKNPPGFPEGNTLAVESINIGLAFWPLLKRQVEITSVGIDNVQVNLLENERGQTNTELRRPNPPTGLGIRITTDPSSAPAWSSPLSLAAAYGVVACTDDRSFLVSGSAGSYRMQLDM